MMPMQNTLAAFILFKLVVTNINLDKHIDTILTGNSAVVAAENMTSPHNKYVFQHPGHHSTGFWLVWDQTAVCKVILSDKKMHTGDLKITFTGKGCFYKIMYHEFHIALNVQIKIRMSCHWAVRLPKLGNIFFYFIFILQWVEQTHSIRKGHLCPSRPPLSLWFFYLFLSSHVSFCLWRNIIFSACFYS